MSRPAFDVLTEAWIPVVRFDGSSDELGILPCLEQAHHIREIKDPSPIVEFGLYRLLVAFVLDVLVLADCRPEDEHDLRDLIDEGSFDEDLLARYVEACGDVFDLFHPEKPFLQTVGTQGEKSRPLAGVYPAMPSGSNAGHWLHVSEKEWSVTPDEAARILTTISPFMTAGGAGLSPSINGSPAVYVQPLGRTLHETLVINLPLRVNQEAGDGMVAWMSSSVPGRERTGASTVEALTWRPRRIQLLAEPQGVSEDSARVRVRFMKFTKGDSTRFSWIDANLAYRYKGERVTPVRMRENRSLWRDTAPLLLMDNKEQGREQSRVSFRRPDVVDRVFRLGITDIPSRINVYGMRTDMKMKIFEWAKSSWTVPFELGRSTRLGSIVSREMDRAEQAASALRGCIKSLSPSKITQTKDALKSAADRCERAYWLELEREFAPLMHVISTLDPNAVEDPDLIIAATKNWRGAIQNLALEQFETGAKDMDADGDALQRLVEARARLQRSLRRVLS